MSARESTNADRLVRDGYGEYIAYQRKEGRITGISKKKYTRIYEISQRYSPISILDHSSSRYELLMAEIRSISSTIFLAFVPRTIYDLEILRNLINEDIQAQAICPFVRIDNLKDVLCTDPIFWTKEKISEFRPSSTCWHKCVFDEEVTDPQEKKVKRIAFDTNNSFIQWMHEIPPEKEVYSLREIEDLGKRIISFFRKHHTDVNQKNKLLPWLDQMLDRCHVPRKINFSGSDSQYGPTLNFAFEKGIGRISTLSLVIRNDNDQQLLMKCIHLECSELAKNAIVLYRGGASGEFTHRDRFLSLSFGSSPFAGSIFDVTGSAFYYMKKGESTAYALVVSNSEIATLPLKITCLNSVRQLYSKGELFHPRTKALLNENGVIRGFHLTEKEFRLPYIFEGSPKEYDHAMNSLFKGVVLLK